MAKKMAERTRTNVQVNASVGVIFEKVLSNIQGDKYKRQKLPKGE